MRQIVRTVLVQGACLLGLVLAVGGAFANAVLAETDAERAFRERRLDMLRSQDPDRVRIDRAQPAQQAPTVPVQTAPVDDTSSPPPSTETDMDAIGKPQAKSLSVSVGELAAAASPHTKQGPGILDFWFEGRYQPYEADDAGAGARDGNLSVMYAGTKYMIGPDIMIGALTQFDRTDELGVTSHSSLAGSGWMTGPYASVRFGPGVIFDGRAAWGTSETSGSHLDNEGQSTERRLVRGTLRGNKPLGAWTFAPTVGMSYIEDKPRGTSAAVQGEALSTVGQGRLEVMPEVKRRFNVNETTFIEPRAAAGGFLAFDELSKLNEVTQFSQSVPDMQMKAEAGVTVGVKDGLNVQAMGGLETSNATTPETWTGRFQLNMPLDK